MAQRTKTPIVLGVDPGLTRCGVGVVSGPSHRPRLVHAECVQTPADMPIERRLNDLYRAVTRIVEEVEPQAVAVERILFSGNARTAMPTGQASGVALLVAAQHDLPVVAYSPNEVKQTITGDGRAEKGAVARMVAAQLGLDQPPRPVDITDALAVAITHLARSRGVGASVIATPARAALEQAAAEAQRAGRAGWEALAAAQDVRRTRTNRRGDAA